MPFAAILVQRTHRRGFCTYSSSSLTFMLKLRQRGERIDNQAESGRGRAGMPTKYLLHYLVYGTVPHARCHAWVEAVNGAIYMTYNNGAKKKSEAGKLEQLSSLRSLPCLCSFVLGVSCFLQVDICA